MTRERRILLTLLGATALCAALGSFLYVRLDHIRTMDEQIAFLRKQYVRLPLDAPIEQADLQQRIVDLGQAESEELARYYGDSEMDLYRFGSTVNTMLARRGISVERVRTITGAATPVLELSARGSSVGLVGFLSDVSVRAKYWTIPYLHVQAPTGSGMVTCEMQVGYLVRKDEE